MKSWLLASVASFVLGCATSPAPISPRQTKAFRDTVRVAERGTASGGCPQADARLREAKTDFYYAEHSPMNPERAKVMATQAQSEADSAVAVMASCH